MRAEVKKPKPNTTSTKPGTCWKAGMILGTTKYHRKICTSKGMLRNNSTQALASRTSQGRLGKVRNVPTRAPTTIATSHEVPATASVQRHASSIHSR